MEFGSKMLSAAGEKIKDQTSLNEAMLSTKWCNNVL